MPGSQHIRGPEWPLDVEPTPTPTLGGPGAVHAAWSRLGGLDMLVNNAGIGMRSVNPRFMTHPCGFWEVPPEGFRAVIDTNLTGYFLVAREVTPRPVIRLGDRDPGGWIGVPYH